MTKNGKCSGFSKKFLKYKLLRFILSAASPVILIFLVILLIISPLLLLFMGSDNGPSYSINKESSLYGCTERCKDRNYLCSDNLEGIYHNCFLISREKESREKNIPL